MMAFISATPQSVNRWFSGHLNSTGRSEDISKSCDSCKPSGPVLNKEKITYRDEHLPVHSKEHIITQRATYLNCHDTFRTPRGTVHAVPDTHCATPQLSRTYSQRLNHTTEPIQHRSMIELDDRRDAHYSTVDYLPTFERPPIQTQPSFRWIRHRTSSSVDMAQSPGRTPTSGFMRFTIQDLMQQECFVGSVNYSIDQPSKLVRIECRKPGCRCVLKNEPALALKIVRGITLVQGHWLLSSKSCSKSPLHLTIQNPTGSSKPRNVYPTPLTDSKMDTSPVVLTSCCPSWFELVSRPGSRNSTHVQCAEVPVWSSGKALWRAKPRFFLLRKPVQCLIGSVNPPLTMSVADVYKPDQAGCNLDASNAITLRAGTVLELLDCRACRVVHHDTSGSCNTVSGNSGGGLLSRHRGKTVPMLQCAVVGAKALVPVASVATDLSFKDGLRWLADGPRLIYLSLDSKSISCSPVAPHIPHQLDSRQAVQQKGSSNASSAGVHSMFSLLSCSQLPGLVRPLTGLRPNEWFPLEKIDRRFAPPGEFGSLGEAPLLMLENCFHGDLIFLEPLSDCKDPMHDSRTVVGQTRPSTSRFFVVTTDMLAQHNFFLADAATTVQYGRALDVHACRVAHFLAACHPAQGLAYLIKHLEDISRALDTGPSHVPLTRTLGPVNSSVKYAAIQAALMSIAAAATLATDDLEDFTAGQQPSYERGSQSELLGTLTLPWGASSLNSIDRYQSSGCLLGSRNRTHSSLSSSLMASEADQMNALCDEIEDIYFYVRNGRFPAQSRSMTSLVHHVTPVSRNHRPIPQSSAPISPQADELFPNGSNRQRAPHKRGSSKGRYTSTDPIGMVKVTQPQTDLVKRPEKSAQIYIPCSLAEMQPIPVCTSTQDLALDARTLMSPKTRVNKPSRVQTTQPEFIDSPTKGNLVRVFQSPAHDSGVDIAVHRSLDSGDRSINQLTHPCKVYTNTRVLTMAKTGSTPGPCSGHHTNAMSQSQITPSQPYVEGDCISPRDRKRSTESGSAFRLQAPRITPSCLGQTDSSCKQPMTEMGHRNQYRPLTGVQDLATYHIHTEQSGIFTGHPFDPSTNQTTVTRFPENARMAKSPLRVINLRQTDSHSLDQLRNNQMMPLNSNMSSQSVSCAFTNSSNALNTRSYCLCQPAVHPHTYQMPSVSSATHRPVDPVPVYPSESFWFDGRTRQPVSRFHPQPILMMMSPESTGEEPPTGWTADPSIGYANQLPPMAYPTTTNTSNRYAKHRTELTNSSPDTGIGGESGVEIPCTLLSNQCGTNKSWPNPVHAEISDRNRRGSFVYPGHGGAKTASVERTKQIYQI